MACAVAPPSPLPARKRRHGSACARTGLGSFPTAALRYRHPLRWQNQGGSHLCDRSRCVPRRGNYRDPSRTSGRTPVEKQPKVARLRPTGNGALWARCSACRPGSCCSPRCCARGKTIAIVVSPDSFSALRLKTVRHPSTGRVLSETSPPGCARNCRSRPRWPAWHAPHRVAVLALRSAGEDSESSARAGATAPGGR